MRSAKQMGGGSSRNKTRRWHEHYEIRPSGHTRAVLTTPLDHRTGSHSPEHIRLTRPQMTIGLSGSDTSLLEYMHRLGPPPAPPGPNIPIIKAIIIRPGVRPQTYKPTAPSIYNLDSSLSGYVESLNNPACTEDYSVSLGQDVELSKFQHGSVGCASTVNTHTTNHSTGERLNSVSKSKTRYYQSNIARETDRKSVQTPNRSYISHSTQKTLEDVPFPRREADDVVNTSKPEAPDTNRSRGTLFSPGNVKSDSLRSNNHIKNATETRPRDVTKNEMIYLRGPSNMSSDLSGMGRSRVDSSGENQVDNVDTMLMSRAKRTTSSLLGTSLVNK